MTAEQAFDLDLSKAGQMRNGLLAEIGKLRELERVHWSPLSNGWIVCRHEDVVEGFSGRLPLSNHKMSKSSFGALSPQEAVRRLPNLTSYPQGWITESDPPRHTRLRKLLGKAFGKSVVEGVRPFAQARIAYLMDTIEKQPQIEFNEGIARQLPGVVILKLLGLPDELYTHLKDWATSFTVGLASALPKLEWLDWAERSMVAMNQVFREQIEERRRHPRGESDLLSVLL